MGNHYRQESRDYKNETPAVKAARDAQEIAIGRMASRIQAQRDGTTSNGTRPAGEPAEAAAARASAGSSPLAMTKAGAAPAPPAAPPPPAMPRARPPAPPGMPKGWSHPDNGMAPLGKHSKQEK
jgi:hypothetical protein